MDGIPDSVSAPQQPNTAAAQTPVPSSIAAPDSPNPGMSSPMPNLGSGPAPNVVPAPAAGPHSPGSC